MERAMRYGYSVGFMDKAAGANLMCDDQCWEDFKKDLLAAGKELEKEESNGKA